jgi:hypothetical protein
MKYQTLEQRLPGLDRAKAKQMTYRRRGARQIDIAINGRVVEQIELYATEEGFFLTGRGGQEFTYRIA